MALCPRHIASWSEDAVTLGRLLTDTVTVAVAVQPLASVPVTVYVVAVVGETVYGLSEEPPVHA